MKEFKENNISEQKKEDPVSIEQSIIAEGRRLLKEDPKGEWMGFLNNFYHYVLPENNDKWMTPRSKIKKIGCWDEKNRDRLEDISNHSEVWLNQTPKEFFETIDRIIAELDTDGEIMEAIARFCNVSNYGERAEAQSKLEEKLIPVFARLVATGYTMRELRG